MPPTDRSAPPSIAHLRLLRRNAARCARSNIVVRVETVSHAHHAAFCSVEQRLRGGLWHTCSVEELTRLAEEALRPLIGMGYVPMIIVRHNDLRNALVLRTPLRLREPAAWSARLRAWLGKPGTGDDRHAFAAVRDPFGWFAALQREAAPGPRSAP